MDTKPSASGLSPRTRRRVAMIAALSLPWALMTAPAIAERPTPSPIPTSPAVDPASTGAALAQAKKENKRVEIESLRSETATYFANPDGKTLNTEFHVDPIRFKKDGAWQSVDTTLVADNDTIRPRATKVGLTLSPGGGTDLLTAANQIDGSTIKVTAPHKLPAPKLLANRAEYPNAYGSGIDLVVIATPTGFRQEAVIRQRPISPLKLTATVQPPTGLSFDETSSGKLVLHDSAAKAERSTTEIPASLLIDASANLSVGEEGQVGKVTPSVEKSPAGQTLVYQPDAKFLTDRDVTYPVTFVMADSDWTQLPVGNDTFINNSSYQNGHANSGAYHLQAGKTNEGNVRWRTYIRFEDIPEDSPLRGGRVTNADLILWNIDSNDCGENVGSGITARRITQRWDVSTLTWSNQPTVTSEAANTEYGAYKPGCSRGYMDYEWDLTHYVNDIAQEWANGKPNYGLQLTSGNESEYSNWRAYRSNEYGEDGSGSHGPKLVIGYEPAQDTELSAVGWFFDGEPELGHDQEYVQSVIDNPELARASATQPVADNITDEQAMDAQELEGQEYEVPPDLMEEDPDADPVEPTPTPEPDTIPPAVSDTEPATDATDVAVDNTIQVQFTEPVHEVVVEVRGPDDTLVAGKTRPNPESHTWTFTPTEPLTAETSHTATASGAVDNAGNSLAAPHSWSFTTGTRTSQPKTIALPVRSDTWIDSEVSRDSSGQTLWTGSYSGINERTYLDFDTTSIVGKRIVNATLKLRNNQSYGCGVNTSGIVAQRVTSAWNTTTLNWENKPTSTADGQVKAQDPGGCSDDASPPVGATWTWDVTGIVHTWASSQTSNGLVLQGADESAEAPLYDRGFDSAESGGASGQAPILEVSYTDGSSPPPTTPPGQDTTPPTVLATDPENDAIEVPTDAQVQVTFSEPVTDVQLVLDDLLLDEEVTGRTTMSADGATLTFTPSYELYGFYRAEITQAKDAGGNAITPYSWYFETAFNSPLKSQTTAARKVAEVKPAVTKTWSKPIGTRFSRTKTPHLMAKALDPLGRRSTVLFEVAHDPSVPAQGEGVIWSGEDPDVTSGTPAMVRVPEGKLRSGWKVRWRAQAAVKGAESSWSEWQTLTVGKQGGSAAKAHSTAAIPPPVKEDPPAPAARIYKRIDTDECFNRWATAGKPQGWIKNHFSWCQIGKIQAVQESWRGTSGNPPIKEEYYKTYVMLIAYTFTGKTAARKAKVEPRDIVVEAYLFDQKTYGTMPLNHEMVLGMDIGNKPYCQHITTYNGAPHTNHKSLKISQWKATPTGRATFRFRCAEDRYQANRTVRWDSEASDKRSIVNEEKVSFGTLKAYANFPTWPKAINKYVSNINETGIATTVRCDSASYVSYKGGCIFYKTRPWVKFHWDKGYDEAFNHYWNACKRPGLETYPTDTSKVIHGCGNINIPAKKNVLHREYPNIRDTNQSNTNRRCNKMWPGYAGGGAKQCDEYPFASTRERTNVRTDKTTAISLCPVSSADNGAAGRILDNHYYSKDRILIGDVFTVGFEEQGMGTQEGRDNLCGIPALDYWP